MPIQLLNIRKFDAPDGALARHVMGGARDGTSEVQMGPDDEPLPAVVDLLPAVGETRPYQARIEDAKAAIAAARAMPTAGRKPKPCIGIVAAGPPAYGAAEAWAQDRIQAWAHRTVEWFRECAPHSVLTAATLHQDETRPHVHILAVARAESGHVGWGRILPGFAQTPAGGRGQDPKRMSEMQTRYHTEVAAPFGLQRDRGDGPRRYEQNPNRQQAELDRAAAGRYSETYLETASPAVRVVAELGSEVRALTARLDGQKSRLPPDDTARLALANSQLRGEVADLRDHMAAMDRLETQVESLTQERDAALAKADQATATVGADRRTLERQTTALQEYRQTEQALTAELAEVKTDRHKLRQAVDTAVTTLQDLPPLSLWRGHGPTAAAAVMAWVRTQAPPSETEGLPDVVDQMLAALPAVGECLDLALGALGVRTQAPREPSPTERQPRLPSESRFKPPGRG